MRDFNDTDRAKKSERIHLPGNPGGLPADTLSRVESAIKASLKNGYLPCPLAWAIARKNHVPRIAVGEVADRLGIRITDCQIGCFKVEKTPYRQSPEKSIDAGVAPLLVSLKEKEFLTCAGVFDLARRHRIKPAVLSDAINAAGLKIHGCQLGCF